MTPRPVCDPIPCLLLISSLAQTDALAKVLNEKGIRGTLFVPLAGEGGYGSWLSDILNKSDKQFLAQTDVKVEALPDTNEKWQARFIASIRMR